MPIAVRRSYSLASLAAPIPALAYAYAALAGFVVVTAMLQSLPLVMPVGPMYWDVLVYYDAIGRMAAGQLPVLDFFTPVGPLEYGLAALSNHLYPLAHPVLMTQWIWLPVTVPVMALIMREAGRDSPKAAIGLLLPWMLFTALPFNVMVIYPYAGSDAFGIYNRHGAHLIYLLVATVLFVRRPAVQAILLAVLTLALAYCKITAFLAAGPILIAGLVTGRIDWRTAALVALLSLLATLAAQLATAIPHVYLVDIWILTQQNSGSILPRLLQVISQHFDVVGAAGLLCLALFAIWLRPRRAAPRAAGQRETGHRGDSRPAGLSRALDTDWFWIGLILACGILFESQNTGGHGFIMLWPALLALLLRTGENANRWRGLVLVLLAFTTIPTVSTVLHKTMRTLATQNAYVRLEAPDLGPLGRISAKDVFVEQGERMRSIYIAHRPTMEAIAETEALPSFLMFSDLDYQYTLLETMQEATVAIRELEAASGRHFATIFNLDFANPFPYILGRSGPKYVAIGADPYRAVPDPDQQTLDAVAATDLILAPVCPVHHARKLLRQIYQDGLKGRARIELTPCFDAYIKPL